MLLTNFRTPLSNSERDHWIWDKDQKSCDAHMIDDSCKSVIFHPSWSVGTSAIRGTKILNNTRTFWEIVLTGGLGGTSLMFGVGTKSASLGSSNYCNLIGKDEHSWGLSHRGLLWHGAKSEKYCRPFKESVSAIIGVLFDGVLGTLTYFKDDVNLGIAFRDLHNIKEPLYPMISSTSMRSIMALKKTEHEFVNLQDRCKAALLQNWKIADIIENNRLPTTIKAYLEDTDDKRCQNCEWYVPII